MKDTIIILTPGFPENEADTTCLPPQQVFVRSLQDEYPQMEIIVFSFQYPYQQKEYNWRHVQVKSFGGANKGGLSRRLLWRKIFSSLEKINRQKRIKAMISFWCGECAYIGKKMAAKYHLKHFCWILGQDARKGNRFIKKIHPQSNELIALSDFIQDEFDKNYAIRPEYVIPPGIDTQLFPREIKQKDIDILAAGSLIPLKQYELFVDVIAALKKDRPGIKAVLAGKGPEKEKLQRLIHEQGLENNIMLTGELPHSELLTLMQRSKIFLHPSSYEGFGVVCIEALYASASVISFCKPMRTAINRWHIVSTTAEMIQKASIILQVDQPHEPVLFNRIESSVKMMVDLF